MYFTVMSIKVSLSSSVDKVAEIEISNRPSTSVMLKKCSGSLSGESIQRPNFPVVWTLSKDKWLWYNRVILSCALSIKVHNEAHFCSYYYFWIVHYRHCPYPGLYINALGQRFNRLMSIHGCIKSLELFLFAFSATNHRCTVARGTSSPWISAKIWTKWK